jgi:hypothetical protein
MAEVGNFIASGGITGAILTGAYFVYKMCYKKRIRSKCCGAAFDVREDNGAPSPDRQTSVDFQEEPPAPKPTPRPSPALKAQAAPEELKLEKLEV